MSIVKSSLPLTVVLAAAIPCIAVAQPAAPATPPTETAVPAEVPVTDADIIMVLSTINELTSQEARDAQKSAQDRRIKKFADTRVKRAAAAKKRQTTLRNRFKLQPSGSAVNDTLKQEFEATYKDLDGLERGAAFDRAYIDNELEALTNIAETINRRLLPAVMLPQLRTELKTVLDQVESDRKEAQRLQTALQQKPTT